MSVFRVSLVAGALLLSAAPRGYAQSPALPDAPSATAAPSAAAQQQASPTPPRPLTDQEKEQQEAAREVKQEEQQRILSVMPNFHTVISGEGVRLSPGQKLELANHAALDPFNAVSSLLLAGVSEAQDTYRGYGWGPAGYFKRVGANYADVTTATYLSEAFYPIVLHQDPRFFRQGTGPVRSRIKHALLSAYVCHGDNGRLQPNYSNLLGNLSAGAVSNVYYPAADRGGALTIENAAIVTVEGSLGNIGLEFSPDVNAWWANRHHR